MRNFPPELHSYICQLASLDDGSTSQALSLVSRYFNEIARPYIYQSLAVTGPEQLSTLASKLETTPPHLRQVRHLFLSDQTSTNTPDHKLKPENTSPTDPNIVTRILTLVAPTLETLTFVSSNPATSTNSIARLFRLFFPRLRELSLSGFYPYPSLPRRFPRLTHLHLNGNRNPHGLLQLGGLDEAFPSLTHLHVSGLSMAVSFAQELQEAFCGVDEPTTLFSSRLPPHVEHVIVQPGSPGPAGKLSTTTLHSRRQKIMKEQLAAAKASMTKGIKLDVLDESQAGSLSDAFKRDWLDRLEGGCGGWA